MAAGQEYDILVIGAGATGCGVALDAVSRGASGARGRRCESREAGVVWGPRRGCGQWLVCRGVSGGRDWVYNMRLSSVVSILNPKLS